MKLFFEPETVAEIGATAGPMKPGYSLFQSLQETFGENFFPVNPKLDVIGNKQCYRGILDVPADIDVAVVFIPAAAVPEALEQCGIKGIKRVIIESGGFAEAGAEGLALHERCLAISKKYGMRLWGPNCMGLINVSRMKVLSFMGPMMWKGRFIAGKVSLVVQSGMLSAGFLLHILSKTPFGLSKVCSIGNKMDVDEVDVLEYLVNDPETGVIAMYLESINRGRRFFELAKSTSKPMVVLKSGRTSFGHKAAASHTAALSQDDAVLDHALRQAGVVRVYGMNEMMDVARSFAVTEREPVKKARVAVLSFSGGAGVVCSDDVADYGMELARFSDETLAKMKSVFPAWMEPSNPVDTYPAIEKRGPTEVINVTVEAAMADPGVDAVYVHFFAPFVKIKLYDYDFLESVVKKHKKPMVAWTMGRGEVAAEIRQELESRGICVVDEIAEGVRILAALTMRR
ncbi:MAG TPA: CoA-binding protein [bacterium]|nr:CoA-binding protein [bacterium]